MNHAILRRFSALALLALALTALPAFAKRRAVAHRSPGVEFTKTVSGVVLDNVTNRPVAALTVTIGTRTAATDKQGRFEIVQARAVGSMLVEFSRSGYQYHTIRLGPADSGNLTVRLTPTATATLRKTNGTVIELDLDSLQFGYGVPFLGYIQAEFEDFCKITDSSKLAVNKSQMRKLTGPAQIVPAGNCCSDNAEKMSLTLKNGEVMEVIFMDTCQERYKVDVSGRDHVSGEFVFTRINEIAELSFP